MFLYTALVCKKPLDGVDTSPVDPSIQFYPSGYVYTYECIKDSMAADGSITECQIDGTWTNPPPTCVGNY